eukprot:gene12057-16134_t
MSAKFTLSEAFTIISKLRHSDINFNPSKAVSRNVLVDILKLTQMAPSSFNLQPYKIIVVKDDVTVRENLKNSMIGTNQEKVAAAPITVIFAADKNPIKSLDNLIKLEKSAGLSLSYINSLPSKVSFMLGNGILSKAIKNIATELTSPINPSPTLPNIETWSVKNTAFAAQQFMLAATSFGCATAPMEGFDERRLCFALDIPMDKFCVPIVISLGYSISSSIEEKIMYNISNENQSEGQVTSSNRRYDLKSMCYLNKFGYPFK